MNVKRTRIGNYRICIHWRRQLRGTGHVSPLFPRIYYFQFAYYEQQEVRQRDTVWFLPHSLLSVTAAAVV